MNKGNMDEILSGQIPDFDKDTAQPVVNENVQTYVNQVEEPKQPQKISSKILNRGRDFDNTENAIGQNIFDRADAAQGWRLVDRALLGERSLYYPEDWRFYVRPATVEVIRNWSMVDEENNNSIDEAFNEIIKYCVKINTATGTRSWANINVWDRFFFVLIVREFTFMQGESKVEFMEECSNCEKPVTFNLTSQSLMYDMPDQSILKYYDRENRMWIIDPNEFDIPSENPVVFYIPTIEKDQNIKAWAIAEYQENNKRKFDNVFIKFLLWLTPKISKEIQIARTQIRKAELEFRGWDTEKFQFMNEVLTNIMVTPSTNISTVCESCGEEVVARLRFQDGVRSLFNMVNRRPKFGTK